MRRTLYPFISLVGLALLAGCMSPPKDLDLSLDRTSDHNTYRVAVHSVADPAPLNQIHAWEIQLRSPNGEAVNGARISVGGGMPQHGHGFPTKPRVTRELGEGRYLIEGVKFSMPGWWQFKLKVDAAPGVDDVTFNTIVASRSTMVAANNGAP